MADSTKAMSTRLMNMKFMQRHLANESKTPSRGEPPSKRQKLANISPATVTSPSSPVFLSPPNDPKSNNEFVKRQAEAAGDTEWYIEGYDALPADARGIKVSNVGFSTIDAEPSDAEGDLDEADLDIKRVRLSGRKSFGKFNEDIEVSPLVI